MRYSPFPGASAYGSRARRVWQGLAFALCLVLLAHASPAVQPDEVLKDPALESRARRLSQELRCLVCQNQSIDDSNAPLARDLRLLLRERLSAGDSDAAVLAFLTARYGEFVLLRPPFNAHTLLLWLAPFLLLAGAALTLYSRSRAAGRRQTAGAAPLSETERQRFAALLGSPTTDATRPEEAFGQTRLPREPSRRHF